MHCIDIKWLSVYDYLDSFSWLEGFSSATLLPIHQLITGCKSQQFILISTPHSCKIEKDCLRRASNALGSHMPLITHT